MLSLVVLGVIAYLTFDPASYAEIERRLVAWPLAAALLTLGFRVVFGGWRLNYFAGGRLGLSGGIRIQLIWDFLSYVTPSTVGGGPFVPVFIARERRLPLGDATSIILFAMLVDQLWFVCMIPVVLIAAAYIEVIPAVVGTIGYWTIVLFLFGFMVWVLVFAYGTLVRPQILVWFVGRALRFRYLRRFRDRGLAVMQDLQARSKILRSQPLGFYLKGFVLTAIPWISRYLLIVFLILSVYPVADEVLALLRSIALHLSSVALPSPGGAGGVEALYALFFGSPLMPAVLVAPTLLAWRLLSYYVFVVVGTFLTIAHVGSAFRARNAGRTARS